MSDPKILKKMEQENQKYKPKPAVVAVYWILRLIVIGVMVMTIIHKNYESTFVCVLVLILFMLPRFVERNFRIELPSTLEIIILIFIFAAEILGEPWQKRCWPSTCSRSAWACDRRVRNLSNRRTNLCSLHSAPAARKT